MKTITPSDFRDAWRGIAQAQELCGVSRRTWRRWLAGLARIPRSAYELGRVLQGEIGIFGEDWRGWRFSRGVLCDPCLIEHTPRTIDAWHWTAQELAAHRHEENLRERDKARGVVSLTHRRGHAITQELDRRVSRGSRSCR